MNYKFQYNTDTEKQNIITANLGKTLIMVEDITEGHFLTFTDSMPIPTSTSLQDLQTAKISQINDLYKQTLAKNFISSANGVATQYSYSENAQESFKKLFLLRANNLIVYPRDVYSALGETISLTQPQLTTLLQDITAIEDSLNTKNHNFLMQVMTCTTVDQVNAIVVAY